MIAGTKIDLNIMFVVFTLITFAMVGYMVWMRERRRDRAESYRDRELQEDREQRRLRLEEKRLEAEEQIRYETSRQETERMAAQQSGTGSGGYIVVEMPETERPLFHDLLKGFEDYAKLKGYHIAFSIDSSHDGRIAFKFTVKNDGFIVGPERVRQDFKDYIEQVRNKDIDEIDHLPVITSIEEHNLLIALLKNRLSFLQHSYKLSQNAVTYYQSLIANVRSFPALPAPSVIVQTGGNMDTRKYEAVNSQRLIQGDSNTYADSSTNIDIGNSFNARQERIAALDDVIEKLKTSEVQDEAVAKAQRELGKVRDELTEYPEPDKSSIKRWLEYAKNMMGTAALGYEAVEAGKKLFEIFGLS
jgi:hypothetical protein